MARRDTDDERYTQPQGAIQRLVLNIKDKLLLPFRLATSKFALRAYLTSILFFSTAFLLFAVAIIAYILFYWSYIPRIGFSRTIHLQYDSIPSECRSHLAQSSSTNLLSSLSPTKPDTDSLTQHCFSSPSPWGTAAIAPELIGQQAYDVVAELHMPLTPLNLEARNFMIDARLLSSLDSSPPYTNPFSTPNPSSITSQAVLAHARRPSILPYRSPLLSLYATVLSLPRATFGLPTDATTLRIPLFTRVSFPRSRSRVPGAVHIQLQTPSGVQLAVYSASIHFRARFTGLRYVMYNFRLTTGAVFVGLFFVAEAIAAGVVWGVLTFLVFGGSGEKGSGQGEEKVKEETETELSDAERTFPTYGRQEPLKFEGRNRIKEEPNGDEEGMGVGEGPSAATLTPGPGGEADDEDDEDADFVLDGSEAGRWRDSGLGTSMESGRERSGGVRRRRSRGGSGNGAR